MVTVVQHHQPTTSDCNQYQKEQDQVSRGTPIEVHDEENCRGEIVHLPKDHVVVVTEDGSLADSSTKCSDVEDDEEEDETDIEEGDWVPDFPVPAIIQQQQVTTTNGNVVLPNTESSSFGDVRVKNSTNVHLGNKTFYKGPVTIKQFVYTNPTAIQDHDVVNSVNGRVSNANTSDVSAANGDVSSQRPILQTNDDRVTKWLWTWRCAAFLCALALLVVTVVVAASVYFTRNFTVPLATVPPDITSFRNYTISPATTPPESLNVTFPAPGRRNVRFVDRNEWGAQPPEESLTKMKLPVPYVIISHTATDFCTTQSECTYRVRFAQTFHIESRNWADIAYSFLVGGDGLIYVGRSWNYMGAHTFGYNNISIGISFIGTFNTVPPPEEQLYAAQWLIDYGVKGGQIAQNYKLLGHRQVSRTLSPGDALYKIITTWPHWSPTP